MCGAAAKEDKGQTSGRGIGRVIHYAKPGLAKYSHCSSIAASVKARVFKKYTHPRYTNARP
jgi:hypothetical protein